MTVQVFCCTNVKPRVCELKVQSHCHVMCYTVITATRASSVVSIQHVKACTDLAMPSTHLQQSHGHAPLKLAVTGCSMHHPADSSTSFAKLTSA